MIYYESYLCHSGTAGMRWHRRRYQNYDGSLTPLGRTHYGYGPARKKTAERASGTTPNGNKASEHTAKRPTASPANGKKKTISKRIESIKKSLKTKKVKNIIRSGSAELIKKNQKLLTNSQMTRALERVKQKNSLLSLSNEQKVLSNTGKESLKAKREEFRARSEERKIQREAKREAKRAKKVEDIIRTGDKKLIEKNKKKFTNEEYQRAVDRIQIEKSLKSVEKKSINWQKVATLTQQINNTLTNTVGIYNTVAAVRNTANSDAPKWKTINTGKDKDKDKDKNSKNEKRDQDIANISDRLDTIVDMYKVGLEGTDKKKHKHDR